VNVAWTFKWLNGAPTAKVKLSCTYHEGIRGSEGTVPFIPTLGIRWRCLVLGTASVGGWMYSGCLVDVKKKTLAPFRESKHGSSVF